MSQVVSRTTTTFATPNLDFATLQWLKKRHKKHLSYGSKLAALTEKTRLLQLREMFESLDADGNGRIEVSEILKAMKLLGMRSRQKRARVLEAFRSHDKDHSGWLDFGEFLHVMTSDLALAGGDATQAASLSDEQEATDDTRLLFFQFATLYRRQMLIKHIKDADELPTRSEKASSSLIAAKKKKTTTPHHTTRNKTTTKTSCPTPAPKKTSVAFFRDLFDVHFMRDATAEEVVAESNEDRRRQLRLRRRQIVDRANKAHRALSTTTPRPPPPRTQPRRSPFRIEDDLQVVANDSASTPTEACDTLAAAGIARKRIRPSPPAGFEQLYS